MNHDLRFANKSSSLAQAMALYLHIPYCRRRCSYCDFNAHVLPGAEGGDPFLPYADALCKDISLQDPALISTVFWGGGTPSLMPIPHLARVVEELEKKFTGAPQLEHSIEVNPGTVDRQKFESYLELGINRLSIGAQSFQAAQLELVGRIHNASQIEDCFVQARGAGFQNMSLDLIYGFPEQTSDDWEETLTRSLALNPEHLSIYQLTVEPSTRLEVQLATGELSLPPEDDMVAMDERAIEVLTQAGYQRYEISNWAKPGHDCKHNLRYWSDLPYLGLGCGAVSFSEGWRIERIKAPAYYQRALSEGRSPVTFAERRGADGALKDHLMMGLRVRGGVRWDELQERYPGLSKEQLQAFFQRLPANWWTFEDECFRLTRKGWDFHSNVTMELMDVMFSFS